MGREFASVGVVGLGTMGAGIVEVFARNGVDVIAVEISDAALHRGEETLRGSVERAVKRGKLSAEERDALLGQVTFGARPGLRGTALLLGSPSQAVAMVEGKYATREDIDAAMKLGCGLPMGPLALMDLIGLDTAYEILDPMYPRGGRDRRHAPVPLIK